MQFIRVLTTRVFSLAVRSNKINRFICEFVYIAPLYALSAVDAKYVMLFYFVVSKLKYAARG